MFCLDNIFLDKKLSTKKEIFEFMQDKLAAKGFVYDTYAEALEERERDNPTGLPTVPFGIAIPHTDTRFVKKPCIIMIRLKTGVQFEQMGNPGNPVDARFVFGLCFTDGRRQVELLAGIIEMTQNLNDMNLLEQTQDRNKIMEVVEKYLKE